MNVIKKYAQSQLNTYWWFIKRK